jgi:hypothetical protein
MYDGRMFSGILPAWVEPDPLRARATDALALQAVADRLADRLLPGLSVLTTRARYFTFLAWARGESGRDHDERQIHRYEVALVFAEALLSDGDATHAVSCQFIGSRNVRTLPRNRIPADPRRVYKVPAWRAYRASMVALGLLEGAPRFSLTDEGSDAAKSFRQAVRPRKGPSSPLPGRACLSEISSTERRQIRDALGLSIRGRLDPESTDERTRRAAFAREVRPIFRSEGLSPEAVLPRYEGRRQPTLPEPIHTLRTAAVWERLSVGLNTLFTVWVRAIDAGRQRTVERDLAQLLSRGLPVTALGSIAMADEDAALAGGLASLRLALRLNDRLCDVGTQLPDREAFELARVFINRSRSPRSRVGEGLAMLLARHQTAKGDDAWVREAGSGQLEIARDAGEGWTIPTLVRPHAYRMAAFSRIAHDLRGI